MKSAICISSWWAWLSTGKDMVPKKKEFAPSSWYTWYTKAKRGIALLCQPIHLQQEVILCCFPNIQSQIPSQNVLEATKQSGMDWQPGFRKQYSIVGGWPLVIPQSSFHQVLWLFSSVGYSWPRMGQRLLPSCLSKGRKHVRNVRCLHTVRKRAYLLCKNFSMT